MVTIGVITHSRSILFKNLLEHLRTSIKFYDGRCRLIVVNNSGKTYRGQIEEAVNQSGVPKISPTVILDSPENNIAVGRNLILDNVETRYLIYIDDDEYPVASWIQSLVNLQASTGQAMVAGPIEPIYGNNATAWVTEVDLHNKGNLETGDLVRRVATGNVLLDLEQVGKSRFDRQFGITGGSDALFFEQLAEKGLNIVWCKDAVVYEKIPDSRSNSRYMIFRCMTQGNNFKRITLRNASGIKKAHFIIKAILVAPTSTFIGVIYLPINTKVAAFWLKRGFTNFGKIIKPTQKMYG